MKGAVKMCLEQLDSSTVIDIENEMNRQVAKFGVQTHAPDLWIVILGEEFGEAAKAVLEMQFSKDQEKIDSWKKNYREELIQIAAVACSALQCFDQRQEELKQWKQQGFLVPPALVLAPPTPEMLEDAPGFQQFMRIDDDTFERIVPFPQCNCITTKDRSWCWLSTHGSIRTIDSVGSCDCKECH